MRCRFLRILFVFVLSFAGAAPLWAAPELWTLATRSDEEGKAVSLPVLADLPAVRPSAVLISFDTGNTKDLIKYEGGAVSYGQPTTPLNRVRQRLLDKGIAILTPAAPSDRSGGIDFNWRESYTHLRDIEALVAEAHKRLPGVPVVLHGYIAGATSLIYAARERISGVDGYVITSGQLGIHRDDSLSGIKTRGLVIQPLSHWCDLTPTPEAREVAAAAHWQFVGAGHARPERQPRCVTNSNTGLVGLDAEYADLLSRWIAGESAPASLGANPAALSYDESVFMVEGASRGLFGKNKIEVSVFTPPGKGPFPLLVFNHGDVEDSPSLRRHLRFRDMVMANEFLAMGFVVAIPARPGVGRSDGIYRRFSGSGGIFIGPATGLLEKGKAHLQEGLAALNFVRGLPQVDASRVVMAGQSAGGFAVACLGLMEPPVEGVKAIINFSGGRTDTPTGETAKGLNEGMVSVFEVLGKSITPPSLWIFAENDSRYTAETIRAAYAAYAAAGGQAKLLLYPAIARDGHFIYHQPDKWRAETRAFLASLGLLSAP
ncbi:hypothetical protein GCM10028811_11800 [Uliginosibacterium sediminicola]